MTGLDLTEATAAAQADVYGDDHSQHIARMAVTSAAPIIAAQVERRVRDAIANDIHAIRPAPPVTDPSLQILDAAYEYAERIARGGAA